MRAVYSMESRAFSALYPAAVRAELAWLLQLTDQLISPATLRRCSSEFAGTEVILAGWGAPRIDSELLEGLPNLSAVFHAGGTLHGIATKEAFDRGVRFFSAIDPTNAPVAEYTLAQVILSLKRVWFHSGAIRHNRKWVRELEGLPGSYHSTIGVLSLGRIGRSVCEKLKQLEVKVIAFDPYVESSTFAACNATPATLQEVFALSDVVTCHLPWLPETERMLDRSLFSLMKPGATFLNTARGAVVDEDAMITVLRDRPDLTAILDVTYPEPPQPGSPLYELPNVCMTPHLAGSVGRECERNGEYILSAVRSFLSGNPVQAEIRLSEWERMGRSR